MAKFSLERDLTRADREWAQDALKRTLDIAMIDVSAAVVFYKATVRSLIDNYYFAGAHHGWLRYPDKEPTEAR